MRNGGNRWRSIWTGCSSPAAPRSPHLRAGGAIVNLASMAGHRGSRDHGHYAAAKGGVLTLSRTLAMELAPAIRVNAVSPGLIDGPMVQPLLAVRGPQLMQQTPLGRLGTADEVARTIVFLCSDWRASSPGVVACEWRALHVLTASPNQAESPHDAGSRRESEALRGPRRQRSGRHRAAPGHVATRALARGCTGRPAARRQSPTGASRPARSCRASTICPRPMASAAPRSARPSAGSSMTGWC